MSRQDFKHVLVAPSIVFGQAAFDSVHFVQCTMEDAELQREVIGLFIVQLTETRDRLKHGSISPEDRKFMSHNLRGAAAAVGALQIEELAKTWESVSYDQAVLSSLLSQAEQAFLAEAKAFYP